SKVADNVVAAISYGDAAAVEAAFANADHVVSLDVLNQRLVTSAMEPRSTIAEVEKKTGRLILHVQSQTPGSTRDVLAEAVLKRPKESVRVLVGDIGGGFGQILLQKSFRGSGRKFLDPLMRFTCGDVRDHIASSKIDHGPP